ncbi:MAG: chemotaxis protein CheW [Candidatus Alkaliphilus sp. MAG34]|nr:purine-binding chemotaxis protein CheW [Clostridiales bacterium]
MSGKQYVIFELEKEKYGVGVMYIQEISEYIKCTEVPNSPGFIEGIINYRGNIVPVINLHNKFNFKPIVITENTRIVISELDGKQIGLLVDSASQVLTINDNDIEEPPDIIMGSGQKIVGGIGKTQDGIIIILDPENILSEEEKRELEQIRD